ncbi:MAG: helix-turn-helix domain-containing protein [Planctomycetes bacterium]|nr:helix-turn-helix domain-containing protein [Planctomycetota bacterium]
MNRPLTLNELAHYLNVSRWTLMRWIKKGQLPAKKMGGRWVVEERILHKFSIERDPCLFTAASPKKLTPVADIHSPYGIRKATYRDNPPIKLKEVVENLGVCCRTVTGWIKQGKLAASKMGGHWVVWQNDLEEFIKRRLLFVEDAAFGMLFFSPRVLEQYRKDFKYYVHEAGFHGRVGNKEARARMHQSRSLTKRHPYIWPKEFFGRDDYKLMDTRGFAELMFWKVRHKDSAAVEACRLQPTIPGSNSSASGGLKLPEYGGWMIAVDPRAFYLLPEPERNKWQPFQIHKPVF